MDALFYVRVALHETGTIFDPFEFLNCGLTDDEKKKCRMSLGIEKVNSMFNTIRIVKLDSDRFMICRPTWLNALYKNSFSGVLDWLRSGR